MRFILPRVRGRGTALAVEGATPHSILHLIAVIHPC